MMRRGTVALAGHLGWLVLPAMLASGLARAHDPIFGLGPHVLYKGGVEVAPELHVDSGGDERETELGLELVYGITGDWAAGIELPYAWIEEGSDRANGAGDVSLFTKFRFWRHDTLGVQKSAAVLLRVKTESADADDVPALGSGSTDLIGGLVYGYESLKWYRWASIRYRVNGETDAGLRRGDVLLIDFAGGWRRTPPRYYEPDTVWLLELNGEHRGRAERDGVELPDTGGTQWFVSPGIFWTKRNFALKAGVQLPLASNLNGAQDPTEYRARLVLEWHL